MKKEIYIRPSCTIVPLSTTLCDDYGLGGSGLGDEQFSRESSFALEEETTTNWENE